jgi:hypothetical protein
MSVTGGRRHAWHARHSEPRVRRPVDADCAARHDHQAAQTLTRAVRGMVLSRIVLVPGQSSPISEDLRPTPEKPALRSTMNGMRRMVARSVESSVAGSNVTSLEERSMSGDG